MNLPEDDEQYLTEKGYVFEMQSDGRAAMLILKGFVVDSDRFDREETDLMFLIPAQYPNAKLDMFYADPPLRLKSGNYPDRADRFKTHGGRSWQRFSRHLPNWRVGNDGLPTLLSFARRELGPKE